MSNPVADFTAVTGAPPAQAQQFLDAAGGDLERAVAAFFEQQAVPMGAGGPAATNASSSMPSSSTATAASSAKRAPSGPRFATLGSLGDGNNSDDDEEDTGDNDDDQPQTFYAGGEKSGMLVQDPNKKKKAGKDLVEAILKQASEGARELAPSSSSATAVSAFRGTGFTLGSDEVPSQMIGGPSSATGSTGQADSEAVVTRALTFWRNGFSIEDGPLMEYTDPANQQILEDIKAGRAPMSLFGVRPGQEAEVRVAHRMQEDYQPPKNVVKPFAGTGNRLGSHVPAAAAPLQSASATAPVGKVVVDETKPKTSVQLRMADGTRMVAHFNTDHTVADIRRFINSARTGEAQRAYTLSTQFPTKLLEDDAATIESAGLKSAVVFQKYV